MIIIVSSAPTSIFGDDGKASCLPCRGAASDNMSFDWYDMATSVGTVICTMLSDSPPKSKSRVALIDSTSVNPHNASHVHLARNGWRSSSTTSITHTNVDDNFMEFILSLEQNISSMLSQHIFSISRDVICDNPCQHIVITGCFPTSDIIHAMMTAIRNGVRRSLTIDHAHCRSPRRFPTHNLNDVILLYRLSDKTGASDVRGDVIPITTHAYLNDTVNDNNHYLTKSDLLQFQSSGICHPSVFDAATTIVTSINKIIGDASTLPTNTAVLTKIIHPKSKDMFQSPKSCAWGWMELFPSIATFYEEDGCSEGSPSFNGGIGSTILKHSIIAPPVCHVPWFDSLPSLSFDRCFISAIIHGQKKATTRIVSKSKHPDAAREELRELKSFAGKLVIATCTILHQSDVDDGYGCCCSTLSPSSAWSSPFSFLPPCFPIPVNVKMDERRGSLPRSNSGRSIVNDGNPTSPDGVSKSGSSRRLRIVSDSSSFRYQRSHSFSDPAAIPCDVLCPGGRPRAITIAFAILRIGTVPLRSVREALEGNEGRLLSRVEGFHLFNFNDGMMQTAGSVDDGGVSRLHSALLSYYPSMSDDDDAVTLHFDCIQTLNNDTYANTYHC